MVRSRPTRRSRRHSPNSAPHEVEYSKRALSDLTRIATYYRSVAGDRVASEAEARIRHLLARISQAPESALIVQERPGLRGAVLVGYPFRIFYRIFGDRIQ